MARRKHRSPLSQPPPARVRQAAARLRRLRIAGFVCGALVVVGIAGFGAWYYEATRPAFSAGGVDLGRPTTGRAGDPLNLLVVTFDTTRADRIGAYGYTAIETPTLDRLADEGVLFDQVMATAPLTLPAHCSIFTSRFPPEHGVRDNGGFFLSPDQPTLAAMLKRRGFATGAVVGAYVLDGKWGLNQGFDTYVDDFDLTKLSGFALGDVRRPGNEVVDRALPWLEKVKSRRFFAWLHFYDPHSPYEPPEPFKSRYRDHPYSGSIAFADSQLSRVVAFLEQNNLLNRTVIAVMGDHGESLNQHNEGTHAFFIYESTIRVPFIVRAPFERLRGRRVVDPVRSVDLLPTVLDLLGISPPKAIAGKSLVPLMTGLVRTMDLEGYAEAMYPLHHFGWSDLRAWRVGRYKAIDAPRPELYDSRARSQRNDQSLRRPSDPGRRHDRSPPPGRARSDRQRRGETRARGRPRGAGAARGPGLRRVVRGDHGRTQGGPGGPEGQDRGVQPDDRRAGNGSGREGARAGHRHVPQGRGRGPQRDRRLVQPRQRALAAPPLRRGDPVFQARARTQARLRPARHQHGQRLPPDGQRRRGARRLPALPRHRPEERPRVVPESARSTSTGATSPARPRTSPRRWNSTRARRQRATPWGCSPSGAATW